MRQRAGHGQRCAVRCAKEAHKRRTDEALDGRTAHGVAVEGAGVAHAEDEALLRSGWTARRRGLAVSAGARTQRVARGWRGVCGAAGCAGGQRDARRTDGGGGDNAGAACTGSARLRRPRQRHGACQAQVRVQLQREHAPCSAHGGEAAQWQQAQRSAARGRQRGVRRRRWWPLACRRREAPWLAVSASGALPRDALLERTRAVCGLDGQRSGSAGEWTRVTCGVCAAWSLNTARVRLMRAGIARPQLPRLRQQMDAASARCQRSVQDRARWKAAEVKHAQAGCNSAGTHGGT
jgi:hypothetical protein